MDAGFRIHFEGTELEKVKYDERVEQIGREMLYLFSLTVGELNG